jgi:colicin import membrane protein/protein TonB
VSAATRSALVAHPDRFRPALVASAVLHAAALAAAILFRPAPIVDLEQKPIMARLVRLGEKRPEHLLPRKEEPPPPPAGEPAPAPVAAAPAPKEAAAPSPRAPPAPPRAPGARGKPDAFSSALSRIRRDQALSPPVGGDPSGDPAGDSSEGEPGDRYLALVQRALHDTYRVPATLSDRDRTQLKATVILYIGPDGRVLRWSFESRSGSAAFDDALERAIRQALLPPPPADLRDRYRSQGLGVRFSI